MWKAKNTNYHWQQKAYRGRNISSVGEIVSASRFGTRISRKKEAYQRNAPKIQENKKNREQTGKISQNVHKIRISEDETSFFEILHPWKPKAEKLVILTPGIQQQTQGWFKSAVWNKWSIDSPTWSKFHEQQFSIVWFQLISFTLTR